ncbi:MAG TPA: hypothetical protein VK826_09550 [Bacteroidia bacterium]|nr:hypothetical protein [Bacteroidia bacterium]
MAQYISTGKFNFLKTIMALVLLGIPCAVLLGLTYGWAMDLIPFIIVDVIVLVGVVALLAALSVGMVHIGVIRNNAVKIICVVVVCFVAWYAQWVYTTQHHFWTSLMKFDRVFEDILEWSENHELSISRSMSSGGAGITGIGLMIVEGIEMLLFFTPVIFVFVAQKDYFCEACGKFNDNKSFYVRGLNETSISSGEQSGDFRFIAELPHHKLAPDGLDPQGNNSAHNIYLSYCPNCLQNGIIDIDRGTFEADKKGKITFGNTTDVTKKTLLNALSTTALREKI